MPTSSKKLANYARILLRLFLLTLTAFHHLPLLFFPRLHFIQQFHFSVEKQIFKFTSGTQKYAYDSTKLSEFRHSTVCVSLHSLSLQNRFRKETNSIEKFNTVLQGLAIWFTNRLPVILIFVYTCLRLLGPRSSLCTFFFFSILSSNLMFKFQIKIWWCRRK